MAARKLKGTTVVGKSKKTAQQVADKGWPSPAKKAGKKRAKNMTKKAKTAIAKAKKSKRQKYYD